jgi:hypothetical protein
MGWKTPAILSLLLLLGAAAAPPGDCLSGGEGLQTLPLSLDLAGRPAAPSGLTGQAFATMPGADGGCRNPLPTNPQATTLRSESADVLHSLPTPDILRRMDEPKRAPSFQ